MPQFILYRQPLQVDTLAVVRYLHHIGHPCAPTRCIAGNHPDWVHELPSIQTPTKRYIGIGSCLDFWQEQSGVEDLLEKAISFSELTGDLRSPVPPSPARRVMCFNHDQMGLAWLGAPLR